MAKKEEILDALKEILSENVGELQAEFDEVYEDVSFTFDELESSIEKLKLD